MKIEDIITVVLGVLCVSLIGLCVYVVMNGNNEIDTSRIDCISKGGVFFHPRNGIICLDPKSVITIK